MTRRFAATRPINSLTTVVALGATMLLFGVARADTITLIGSDIPLRDCEIQDFRSGRLYYRDLRGRRQWREIEDVVALGFDGLPQLDEAERLLREGESDAGLVQLLQALLAADGVHQELWLRVRLIRAHENRGEFVPAVGHMARLFQLRDETYWRIMEPVIAPAESSYAATRETIENLREAERTIENHDLKGVVRRLLSVVQPLNDRAAAEYTGPPIAAGSTRSGFSIEQIRRGRLEPGGGPAAPIAPAGRTAAPATNPSGVTPAGTGPSATGKSPAARRVGDRPGAERPDGTAAPAPPAPPTPIGRGTSGIDTPEAIDRLLETGRAEAAVRLCEQIAHRPGERSLSRFLHQFGRALDDAGRPDDAAVMYMRCAILFDTSPFTAQCLLETAKIHREHYRDVHAAKRLIMKAIETAEKAGSTQADVVERARSMLAGLREEIER